MEYFSFRSIPLRISLSQTITALACFVLCSCGGGGGSGSGGRSSSGNSARTGIRILHGAIDASPVEVTTSLNTSEIVSSAAFAESSFYGELPTGDQTVSLFLRFNPAVLYLSSLLSVDKNQHYSILLYGDSAALGLRTSLLLDDPGEIPEGSAAVRVVHSVVGAASLGVSVGGVALGSSSVSFGRASEYTSVPAGLVDFVIRRGVDQRIIDSLSVEIQEGRAYTLFATGEIDYLVVTRLLED